MQYKLGSARPKTNLLCRRLPTVVPLFYLIFSKLTDIPEHELCLLLQKIEQETIGYCANFACNITVEILRLQNSSKPTVVETLQP